LGTLHDEGVKIVFEKETYMIVRGGMVLLKGVHIGTIYKLLGSTISNVCNNSIFLEIGFEEEKTPTASRENIILWHQILGHIKENGFRVLHGKGMVELMPDFSLNFDFC
jgi:hypothetical protein